MDEMENSIPARVVRLERELTLWRVLGLVVATMLTLAFAQEKQPKEIRLASEDGRQMITLSPQGIEFSDRGKKLGQISFETIGDGEQQEVEMKLSGQVSVNRIFLEDGKNRLALSAERVAFAEGYTPRATLTPYGVLLQDRGTRSQISLTTPSQGIGGLDFVEDGKLILALGPFEKFRADNPPRRDAGAIHIGDFGPAPKTRLITAEEPETRSAR